MRCSARPPRNPEDLARAEAHGHRGVDPGGVGRRCPAPHPQPSRPRPGCRTCVPCRRPLALNCVANGKVLREGPLSRDIWNPGPAAGDAGGALRGRRLGPPYHNPRRPTNARCRNSIERHGPEAYLGPEISPTPISKDVLTDIGGARNLRPWAARNDHARTQAAKAAGRRPSRGLVPGPHGVLARARAPRQSLDPRRPAARPEACRKNLKPQGQVPRGAFRAVLPHRSCASGLPNGFDLDVDSPYHCCSSLRWPNGRCGT